MRNMKSKTWGWTALALALGAATVLTVGCAQTKPVSGQTGSGKVASTESGAQLWAENCIRCHNTRSPDMYSDAQWEVAMLHMRARANLTADEHQAIVAFLKFAH